MDQYMTVKDTKGTAFYRVPKFLFTDVKYSKISTDAKILYGLLLDRMSLSEKNGWTDQYGEVYQIFTVDQAHKVLNFGHEKICALFKELSDNKLINRKRQGCGKASVTYLNKLPEFGISGIPENGKK